MLPYIALFLTLFLTGRQGAFAQGTAEPVQNSVETATSAPLKPLEIDLVDLKKILQRDKTSPHPLLLNFWATWCDPCREEFPDLLKIEADYRKQNLDFVAVSFDFSEDVQTAVPDFFKQVKADVTPYWLNIPDPEPAIKMVDPAWGGGIPTTFLFDAQGNLVFKHTGRVKAAELRAAIDKMLNATR